jgi:hypothetical protein
MKIVLRDQSISPSESSKMRATPFPNEGMRRSAADGTPDAIGAVSVTVSPDT